MGLIFEVILVVLLCTAIGLGIILNRRIKELRKDQENLDKLAKNFANATSRAEASIQQLKVTSDVTSQALEKTIKEASGIHEDLIYLIERGEKLADFLEVGIRAKEKVLPTAEKPVKKQNLVAPTKVLQNPAKGDAERELIKALRAVR